jgi:hypothetical protein
MRRFLALLAPGLILALAGCSKEKAVEAPKRPQLATTPEARPASTNGIDACSLLTSNEIEAIQGAPLMDTKSSSHSREGFTVSECYFLLPIAANSIVLTVTKKADGSNPNNPKQTWGEIFHGDKEKEKESRREEEESKSPSPEPIAGLGDEAFWMPQRFGGSLYALKGNTYIRISVGGLSERAAQIQKSKALAEIVLKRL